VSESEKETKDGDGPVMEKRGEWVWKGGACGALPGSWSKRRIKQATKVDKSGKLMSVM